MLKPLYIIPARRGSKGIPRKNIKSLGGRPLIAWSIDAAREAGATDERIILSTEDEEIATIGQSLGLATEYRRPDELASDTAGSREVVLDAMDWAESHGIEFDCIVLLQPTSPLRTADDIRQALSLYSPDIDMVVTVMPARSNPYYNCFESDAETGYLHVSKGEGLFTRRQDAPPAWEYNGAVYVINPVSIRKMPLGKFPRRLASPMPEERSIDLDNMLDWIVAESIINEKAKGAL